MNDSFKVVLGLALVSLVIASMLAFLLNQETIGFPGILLVLIVFLLVVGATVFVWKRMQALKLGLPAEDELSKKVMVKSGSYGFFAAIYGALGVMFYNSLAEDNGVWPLLDANRTAEAIILISAIVFMASALYLSRKGNP